MKILHVVQCYDPVHGGSEWLTQMLSEQLVGRYGDEVTVFTTNASTPRSFWWPSGPLLPAGTEWINGVKVRRFPFFGGAVLPRMALAHLAHRLKLPYNDWARTFQTGPLIPQMPEAIARSGADIVLATSFPFMHPFYALLGGRRAAIPVVLLGSLHTEDRWGYARENLYQAARAADAYIALTPYERDHLAAAGVARARLRVIGAGVEAARFAVGDGRSIRQRYGWGDDPVLAVLARHSPLKRLDVVLRAMPGVWRHLPAARLLIAGARTPFSPQLDHLVEGFPAAQRARITMVSDFPEADKADLLAACDLLVHPSGNESFGIALVEAWAAGKPVIGARVGAIGSLIDEGVDGLLHRYLDEEALSDAVVALLRDPARRAQMGAAGRRKVHARYTWVQVAAQVRTLYEELVTTHPSGKPGRSDYSAGSVPAADR